MMRTKVPIPVFSFPYLSSSLCPWYHFLVFLSLTAAQSNYSAEGRPRPPLPPRRSCRLVRWRTQRAEEGLFFPLLEFLLVNWEWFCSNLWLNFFLYTLLESSCSLSGLGIGAHLGGGVQQLYISRRVSRGAGAGRPQRAAVLHGYHGLAGRVGDPQLRHEEGGRPSLSSLCRGPEGIHIQES